MVPYTVSYPGAKFAETRNLSVHTESENATHPIRKYLIFVQQHKHTQLEHL